jgi:two-component system, NarL family, nitrate/nitrite response regulator NarL
MSINLVLADDHPIVIEGLEKLFSCEKDFKVVAQCGTGDDALLAVRKHRPDILLLDIRMPGKDAFDVIREIQKEKLPTRIVLLTAVLNEDQAWDALHLGVYGIVLKNMAAKLLVQCIRKVHAGERWLERISSAQAFDKMLRREVGGREVGSVLSPREIEIVRLLSGGLRNKEIGKKLFISEGTVKIHLHHVFEKLKLNSRVALTLYAREKGLI